MANRFLDSGEHYNTADILYKYDASFGSPSVSTSVYPPGRSKSIFLNSSGFGQSLTKTLDNQQVWYVGFRARFSALPSANTDFLYFSDSGTTQSTLRISTTGQILFTRNGTTLTGGTSTNVLAANTWYFIEASVSISDSVSSGQCVVRVGEEEWLSVTAGQDTKNTSNAYANQIAWRGANVASLYVADVYVNDGTGTSSNGFYGDGAVYYLPANGAGNSTQWTPSSGSNYECVDDAQLNGDTDYVSSGSIGQIDQYALTNVPVAGTVKSIQSVFGARKHGAGSRSVRAKLRTNATDYSGTTWSLPDSYKFYFDVWDKNPNTGNPWTDSEIDSLQNGVEVVS